LSILVPVYFFQTFCRTFSVVAFSVFCPSWFWRLCCYRRFAVFFFLFSGFSFFCVSLRAASSLPPLLETLYLGGGAAGGLPGGGAGGTSVANDLGLCLAYYRFFVFFFFFLFRSVVILFLPLLLFLFFCVCVFVQAVQAEVKSIDVFLLF
jgi:hypothetical protein